MENYDVLVIGAGAAGMIAALEMALTGRKVAVVEAHEKAGGRMKTIYAKEGQPVELGAEFVHGNLPITKELAQKAGATMYEVKGSIWQYKERHLQKQQDFIEDYSVLENKWKNLEKDLSVKKFLEEQLAGNEHEDLRFTIQNYVEGYYAADISKASLFALRKELTEADEEQYRLYGGYHVLVDYLFTECKKKGVRFFFRQPVLQLHWQTGSVEAITTEGSFAARQALVTVSIGVLQKGGITFSPALLSKAEAAKKLGYGQVIKTNFLFEKAFWKEKERTGSKDLSNLSFLFSEEAIPTWWTQHPKDFPLLSGWLGGPKAAAFSTLDDDTLFNKGLHSLGAILDRDMISLNQMLTEKHMYNWSVDPYFEGAYSYEVLDGEKHRNEIIQPVEGTLYFAGEGLHSGPEIGTVEAALQSGRSVAQRLIAGF